MQQEEIKKIKEIAKEVAREIIKEEEFRKTVRIEDLEKNKDTSTIRIFVCLATAFPHCPVWVGAGKQMITRSRNHYVRKRTPE